MQRHRHQCMPRTGALETAISRASFIFFECLTLHSGARAAVVVWVGGVRGAAVHRHSRYTHTCCCLVVCTVSAHRAGVSPRPVAHLLEPRLLSSPAPPRGHPVCTQSPRVSSPALMCQLPCLAAPAMQRLFASGSAEDDRMPVEDRRPPVPATWLDRTVPGAAERQWPWMGRPGLPLLRASAPNQHLRGPPGSRGAGSTSPLAFTDAIGAVPRPRPRQPYLQAGVRAPTAASRGITWRFSSLTGLRVRAQPNLAPAPCALCAAGHGAGRPCSLCLT